ncbi:MAG: tetratricopeptide repeat protein [Planctomycetota bacterium]
MSERSPRKPDTRRVFARRRRIALGAILALVATVVGVGGFRYAVFRLESRAMLTEGHALMQAGEYGAAAELFQRYIPRRPSNKQALYDLARVKTGGPSPTREQLLDATAALQTLLADRPDHRDGQHLLLRCLLGLGDGKGATALAEKLVAAVPDHPDALRTLFATDPPERAVARARAMRGRLLPPATQRVVHEALIRAHTARGDRDQALAVAEEALYLEPSSFPAFERYLVLATPHLTPAQLSRQTEAHAQRQTNKIESDLVTAVGLQAVVHASARNDYTPGPEIEPSAARIGLLLESLLERENELAVEHRLVLAQALFRSGQSHEGLNLLHTAAERFPSHKPLRTRWWNALSVYGNAAWLDRVLESSAGRPRAVTEWAALAAVQHRLGADTGPAAVAEALGADADDPVAAAWLACLDVAKQTPLSAETLRIVSRALAARPDDAALWFAAGELHGRLGDAPRAALSYAHASRLEPAWATAVQRWHDHAEATATASVANAAADHRRGLRFVQGRGPNAQDREGRTVEPIPAPTALTADSEALLGRLVGAADFAELERASRDAAASADELGPYLPKELRQALVRALLAGGRLDLAYRYGVDEAAADRGLVQQITSLRAVVNRPEPQRPSPRRTHASNGPTTDQRDSPLWRAYRGERADKLRPYAAGLMAADRAAEAERLLHFLLVFDPSSPAACLFDLATAASERGDTSLALAWLDRWRAAETGEPPEPSALRWAADRYLAAGQTDVAADLWQDLAHREAEGRDALLATAAGLIDAPDRLAVLVEAVSRTRTPASNDVGFALTLAGWCDRAAGSRGEAADTEDERDRLAAARAGRALLEPWIAQARTQHRDALAWSARLSHRAGEPDEAERLYRRALRLRPDSPSLRNNLALVLAERGVSLEEARGLADAVRGELGEHPAVIHTLTLIDRRQRPKNESIYAGP